MHVPGLPNKGRNEKTNIFYMRVCVCKYVRVQ